MNLSRISYWILASLLGLKSGKDFTGIFQLLFEVQLHQRIYSKEYVKKIQCKQVNDYIHRCEIYYWPQIEQVLSKWWMMFIKILNIFDLVFFVWYRISMTCIDFLDWASKKRSILWMQVKMLIAICESFRSPLQEWS